MEEELAKRDRAWIEINLENPTTGERIPGNLCIKSRVENDVIVHKFEFE